MIDFFFRFWPPGGTVEFRGQGSDPSHSCKLQRSYSNLDPEPLRQAEDRTCVLGLQRRCVDPVASPWSTPYEQLTIHSFVISTVIYKVG